MGKSYKPGRNRRRALVQQLREEGRQAFLQGRHRQNNPYGIVDGMQWLHGYDQAQSEVTNGGLTEEQRELILGTLLEWFPWLGTGEETRPVDQIEVLQQLFESVKETR